MSAMDEFSDDEMRSNVLNDPGLFLDLEDDDDDVVLSNMLMPPNSLVAQSLSSQLAPQQSAQPPTSLPSPIARVSNVGVPKLDVTALSNASSTAPGQMQQQQVYGTHGTASSPMAFLRDDAADSAAFAFPSSTQSSPHNTATSPNLAAFNVYSNIACPPLCAKKLNFREFLNQKAVSENIKDEESTGIFVGQLPSSYSEDDIEALLKAIGSEHGQTVQVRDVKSHNRDRTCAFVMINASALNAVLDFTKRVLCDINCVWVVDHSQTAQLPIFIQQMPRDQLRGVPKAALVLEKLTPQSKPRNFAHPTQTGLVATPPAGCGNIQQNLISPPGVISHPIFLQQPPQQQGSGGLPNGMMMPPAAYMDAAGLQATSPFSGSGYAPPSPRGNGLPQFFNPAAFQPPGTSGTQFSTNGVAANPTSIYTMPMGVSNGIANIEAANQMMIAASRSRANSQSHNLSMASLPLLNGPTDNLTPVRTAVQLTPVLQQEHCSCGRMLFLSQYLKTGTCAKCSTSITQREVAYWCPNGHIAVCIMCALQTSIATDINCMASTRFMQPQGEMMHN
ncbi:hypothetical protein ABL78_0101 [Leptomonas seymouri]|uniref:RRM domain-containing protein n=1 Tax=Leptomonas seymouri TaxID=5684 RepID=A0A0N1IMP7_LEPSE|nr:hypothetical protein ABL78_0101 [Leptomonas seymouri]|eukprot:KPI90868.1 hypothetical protein ABL78_0101 [Leptomonas seymouri]